jgi:hypothetical protein
MAVVDHELTTAQKERPRLAHNWLAINHPQLYADVNSGPGPGAARGITDLYQALEMGLQEITELLDTSLDVIHGNWQGTSATWATAAVEIVRSWNDQTMSAVQTAVSSVASEAEALEWARINMPAPVPPTAPDPFFPMVDYEEEMQRNASHERAAEVMATYESISASNSVTFPVFEPLPPVFLPPEGENEIGGPGNPPAPRPSPQPQPQPQPNPGMQQAVQGPPTQQDPSSTPPPGPVQPGFHPVPPPDRTDLSQTTFPPPSTTATPPPSAGAEQVRTPGGSPVGFGPLTRGPGGMSPGSPNPTGRGPGVIGRGPGAAEGIAGRGTTPATAGQGRAGAPGMVPGAGAARKEEDQEHQRKYVVDDDEGFQLDDVLPPPVIGEDHR